jgi:hypothetical protein
LGAALGASTPFAAALGLIEVGADTTFDLGDASLDLGCDDLMVAGVLAGGTGPAIQVGNLEIELGGTLQGELGAFEVTGNWTNAGSFAAGMSTVRFVDGCGATQATISGSTTFDVLEMITSAGKLYSFEAGATQTVQTNLLLMGTSGALLLLRSTSEGSEAFSELQGTQDVSFVDVKDNHSTGTAIGLPLANSFSSGNTTGWTVVPEPGSVSLAIAAFSALALLRTRRL